MIICAQRAESRASANSLTNLLMHAYKRNCHKLAFDRSWVASLLHMHYTWALDVVVRSQMDNRNWVMMYTQGTYRQHYCPNRKSFQRVRVRSGNFVPECTILGIIDVKRKQGEKYIGQTRRRGGVAYLPHLIVEANSVFFLIQIPSTPTSLVACHWVISRSVNAARHLR